MIYYGLLSLSATCLYLNRSRGCILEYYFAKARHVSINQLSISRNKVSVIADFQINYSYLILALRKTSRFDQLITI